MAGTMEFHLTLSADRSIVIAADNPPNVRLTHRRKRSGSNQGEDIGDRRDRSSIDCRVRRRSLLSSAVNGSPMLAITQHAAEPCRIFPRLPDGEELFHA